MQLGRALRFIFLWLCARLSLYLINFTPISMKNFIRTTATVLACISFLSCRDDRTGVEITIDGWGDDTVYMVSYIWGDENEKMDTLKADGGRITFMTSKNDTTEIIVCSSLDCTYRPNLEPLVTDSYSVHTVILPGVFEKITGKRTDKGVIYDSDGVELQSQMASEHTNMLPLLNIGDSLNVIIETPNTPYSSLIRAFDAHTSLKNTKDSLRKEYINAHPSSQLSGRYICSLGYDEMPEYANKLNPEVLHGIYKDRIDMALKKAEEYATVQRNKKAIVVGNPAPDFTLVDINGDKRSLSEFRGRYVVIDFWGTWCGWCMKGIPDMKKLYKKYNDKMEIIGIACRDTREKWRKAVSEHDMEWTNLINENDNDVAVLYAVEGYPTKIIVDPEGKILSVSTEESPEFYTAVSELLD